MPPQPPLPATLRERLLRTFRFAWPLVPLLLACAVVVLAGLLLPINSSTEDIVRPSRGIPRPEAPEAATPVEEDLSDFLAIDRWGAPAVREQPDDASAEPGGAEDQPGLNPALQGIGFVGVTAMEDDYAVLLDLSAAAQPQIGQGRPATTPDMPTGLVRIRPGETLPDRRTLVAATLDSVTLATDDGRQQTHRLFGDWDHSAD